LRRVGFAGDAMQLVIAVADGLGGGAGLVGRGRGLLQQIAVSIAAVGDGTLREKIAAFRLTPFP
jgi:hypothetical protein